MTDRDSQILAVTPPAKVSKKIMGTGVWCIKDSIWVVVMLTTGQDCPTACPFGQARHGRIDYPTLPR